jgi:Leucine-rich repeat (LRR) protein
MPAEARPRLARDGSQLRSPTLRRAGVCAASGLLALALMGGADAAARSRLGPDGIRARLGDIGFVLTSDTGAITATADSLDNEGLSKGTPWLAKLGHRLRSLDLSGSRVTNVDALKGLTALRSLDLARMPISNIDALKGLTALRTLNLSGTQVGKADALKGLALQRLDLSGTPVANIDPLTGLSVLQWLNLSETRVTVSIPSKD